MRQSCGMIVCMGLQDADPPSQSQRSFSALNLADGCEHLFTDFLFQCSKSVGVCAEWEGDEDI